MYEMMERS